MSVPSTGCAAWYQPCFRASIRAHTQKSARGPDRNCANNLLPSLLRWSRLRRTVGQISFQSRRDASVFPHPSMPRLLTHTQHGKRAFATVDPDCSLRASLSPIQTFARDGSDRKGLRNHELRRVSNLPRRQGWQLVCTPQLVRSPQLVSQSAVSLRSAIAVGPQSSAVSSQSSAVIPQPAEPTARR
jgi:hypothetical protein